MGTLPRHHAGGALAPGNLLASSNWLQLKITAGTNTEATEILAEAGRTKRIRNTARTGLNHRSEN